MNCDLCGSEPIFHQRYSGAHLCMEHFQRSVEKRIRHQVRESGIIKSCQHIAVAISGGKDSATCLHQINSIVDNNTCTTLSAILVDEGIEGYRNETVTTAEELCIQTGIKLEKVSFKDIWGVTLDEIISRKGVENACGYCGVLRRWALNRKAREIGAQAVLTGHNLDDEAQTVLLNVLDNDLDRLVRMGQSRRIEGLVPRYKPLSWIPEQEIALYAITMQIPYSENVCPYHGSSARNDVRFLIEAYEDRHPGTLHSIMRFYNGIRPLLTDELQGDDAEIIMCEKCGEPGSSPICRACSLVFEI